MKTNSKRYINIFKFLLNAAWYLNIAIIALVFIAVICQSTILHTVKIRIPVKYPLKEQITTFTPFNSSDGPVKVFSKEAAVVLNLKSSFINFVLAYFFILVFEVLIIIIIYQLRKFFTSIQQKQPFEAVNIRRLKISALCFALLSISNIFYGLEQYFLLIHHVKEHDKMFFAWTSDMVGIIIGVVLFIMADVFRYGFELKKENGEFV